MPRQDVPRAYEVAGWRCAIDRKALERLDDARLAAWDTHRLDAFVDLLADDFVLRDTTIGAPVTTKEGAREYVRARLTALPDMRIRRTSRLVDEDDGSVAAEVEFTGTHTGPMAVGSRQVPPTGKTVVGRGAYFARVKDGLFVELSIHPDLAGIMAQLGLMP
ncbi:ester cyclase [Micromonospora sp. NPDC007230]|uniref:ester cyclase n=1 Tax=Micromonospora sp. NPDC007230 TaxID=3364237 RepID=UPI0036A9776B